MPNHDWICTACQTENPPYTEVCRDCYKPALPENYIRRCRCGEALTDRAIICEKCEAAAQALSEAKNKEVTEEQVMPEVPGYWQGDVYVPNYIPWKARVTNFFFSVALLAYGGIGLYIDDLYLPGKRGNGIHLHGIHAWLMYGAFLAASVSMLAVVADHLDHRPNEGIYKATEKYAGYAGWGLFGLSLIAWLLYKP